MYYGFCDLVGRRRYKEKEEKTRGGHEWDLLIKNRTLETHITQHNTHCMEGGVLLMRMVGSGIGKGASIIKSIDRSIWQKV